MAFRNFRVHRDQRGVVTAALDVPGQTHNMFDESVIAELQTLLDQWEHDDQLRLVVLTSDKESGFLTGANLREIAAIGSHWTAEQVISIGQRLFDRIERLRQPTVAVIHGPCLGGGLELALACRYRLARDDRHTRLGFPEIELGLLPGWGGTQRLPPLVGLAAALPMILTGRKVSAREAARLGLVDRALPGERFGTGVEEFIADRLAEKPYQRQRPGWFARLRDRTRLGQRIVLRAAHRQVARRSRHYPALTAALDAVEQGLFRGRQHGLSREREALAELLFTPVCRNLIDLFFQRERARKPSTWVVEPSQSLPDIRRIAVIGAGAMGAGIAHLAAFRGLDVVLKDVDEAMLTSGRRRIETLMDQAQRKGLLSAAESAERLQAIATCRDWEPLAGVDLAIEAVPEREEIKREVFRQLDQRLPPAALVVSNTSALSISRLAAATGRPDRVAGLHFFNPVHRMQLVEIARADATSDATVAALVEFVRRLGKVPLVVADAPGFVVNRVLFPYLDEAVRLVCEGEPSAQVDRSAREFGMPMGPLELLDQVGLDVAADVSRTLSATGSDPSPTPQCLAEMVSRGWTGKKSGRGFYRYRRGRRGRPVPWDPQFLQAVAVPAPAPARGPEPESEWADRYQQRLICALINEAARCLEQEVVAAPWMVDLALVLGIGFAPFRGGPLRLADRCGIDRLVRDLEHLHDTCGDRFAPCRRLQEMRARADTFYPERAAEPAATEPEDAARQPEHQRQS